MAIKGNLGVILVDMQEDYLDNLDIKDVDPLIESQRIVLQRCAGYNIPLIVLEYSGGYLGFDTSQPTIRCLDEAVNKIPRRRTLPKKRKNGFSNKELDWQLREWNVNNLFLMGIYASQCVYQTAKCGMDLGYRIYSSKDVVGDPDNTGENQAELKIIYSQIGRWYTSYYEFFIGMGLK